MGDECPICLEVIDPKSVCNTVCGHKFHSKCAFLAVRNDPEGRCPNCREPLVPRTRPTNVSVEIEGIEFSEFSEQVRREQRNYNARRRRAEKQDEGLLSLRKRWKEAEKDVVLMDKKLDCQISFEMKQLYKRPVVRVIRTERNKAMRKESRLKRSYNKQIEERVGPRPMSPLERLLADNSDPW